MEEQLNTERRRKSRLPLVAAVVVIVLAGVVAYVLFAGRAKTDPASYLPQEVALAVTVDLTRSADKDAALDVIRGVFKDAGMQKPDQELFKWLSDGLKLDFEKDVLSHLSGTAGAAVLTEMNGMMPVTVAVICTKTDDDADAIVKTLERKLSQNKVAFQKRAYKGFNYWRIPVGSQTPGMPFGGPQLINYAGAVNGAVVWANSEGGFKKVIDTVKGQASLLEDSNFTRLRKTRPSTFAVLYASGPGYYKLISPILNMSMGMMGGEVPPELKEQMENAVAVVATADANGEGIKLDAMGITKKPGPQYRSLPLTDMASQFPADAKIVYAFNSWDKIWVEFKKVALSNPMLKSQIAQATTQAKQMVGFDPLPDLLDRLTGFAAYYVPAKGVSSNAFPGTLTFVITVDKPDVVKKSIAKLHAFAATAGQMKVTKASVAGSEISVLPLGTDGGKLGDIVLGNKVIVTIAGSSITQAMGRAISAAQGKGSTLADSAGYKLVKDQLPSKGLGLFYGDVGGIVNVFKDDMPAQDRKKVEAVFKHVGWFAGSGDVQGTESTGTTFIPFKK